MDRNEIALRYAVAYLTTPHAPHVVPPWTEPHDVVAREAFNRADAFLAASQPATVASESPRPEWVPKVGDRVRVTMDWPNAASVKRGDEYVATAIGTDAHPYTEVYGAGPEGYQYVRVENLEPCPAPSSPPSGEAPEPRRTVGAVTRNAYDGALWIVLNGGDTDCCRPLEKPDWYPLGDLLRDDEFVRWATREECERHGLTWVDRAAAGLPPAEAPVDEAKEREAATKAYREGADGSVDMAQTYTTCRDSFVNGWLARARAAAPTATRSVDRDGLAKAMRAAAVPKLAGYTDRGACEWDALALDVKEGWLAAADAAIAFLNGGAK